MFTLRQKQIIVYVLGFLTFFINKFAFAANTGSITISGTVPAQTSITVTPTTGYNSLDIPSGETNKTVANITEYNNTAAGYTVTLSSLNGGKLKNSSLGEFTYTAKYNNVSISLTTLPTNITTQGSQSTVINISKPLNISFPAQTDLMQGNYSDTIIFTITSN